MAKLPIDINEFNAQLDLTTVEVTDKDAGILARQFAPEPVSYTGRGFLQINGGTGFRHFTEGTEKDTKNAKQRGDAVAKLRKIPCVTLYDFLVIDKKLFKIYDANDIEFDVTETNDEDVIAAWQKSENYTAFTDAVKNAIVQNAQRVIDNLGFYGTDAYGNAVPSVQGAIDSQFVGSATDASEALDVAGSLVGNPAFGGTSNSFAAALKKSESAKNSNANRITFGQFDYDGISFNRSDLVESESAFVYSASAFKWGFAGGIDLELLKEATLDDGTNLALSNQYAIRAEIYVGALWNLDKVAKAEVVTKPVK